MAACLPQDGDPSDPDKPGPSSTLHPVRQPAVGTPEGTVPFCAPPQDNKLKDDKAYDEVANYNEDEFRNFLDQVANATKRKNENSISPYALALIRKEQDALKEESSSGDDTRDLVHSCRIKKTISGRREQSSGDQQSAASRTSTGGSLGSLHDLSETKQPKKAAGPNQGVASRCREGGSCGNLSRGSFETQPPRKRKGRRSRDAAARASTSQREGGSLQNLSKTEAAAGDSKKLHKSGSLSQVCSEVIRSKNRRQKTASESSSCRYSRRSEDREGGQESSGDEAAGNNRCRLLAHSPHATEHTFPPEGVGGATGGISPDCGNDVDDSMSDVDSEGETTEDEVEQPIRSLVSRDISELEENGIELQTITCHKAEFDNPPTEVPVDKGINFSLSQSKVETMLSNCSRRNLPLQDSQCVTSCFKEEKLINKATVLEEESVGKRKLMGNRNDTSGSENKPALDENGNPVSSTIFPTVATGDRNTHVSTQLHPSSRSRSVMNNPLKDVSRFDRVRARNDKKKAIKEKGTLKVQEISGFCGDKDIDELLKYLGADVDSNSGKNKKKHKGKKDDKDEKELPRKKSKSCEKSFEDGVAERYRNEEGRGKLSDESSVVEGELSRDNNRKNKEREEEKKSGKKTRNNDAKKSKKGGGNLRESSSVEDLVSKSKQCGNVREIRKQMTVDDGDMSLHVLRTYHTRKKGDKVNNVISDGLCIKEPKVVDGSTNNEVDVDHNTSEFVADFYSVGDSYVTPGVAPTPVSSSGGDFEVVSSKKKSKRFKNGSQSSKSGGSDRCSGSSNGGSTYGDDGFRYQKFGHTKFSHKWSERPHINFGEGPRTAHENTFLAQWSQLGVGDRYGERYATTTTSAPHSEDSGSDGDDSVHSMPVPSITPRPDVRKPPPSSGSTPQASYANIAASTNRTQMKRTSPAVSQTGGVVSRELEKEPVMSENVEAVDSKLPVLSESRPTNILDDNFPPLAESLGGIGPPSSVSVKLSEQRTNSTSENTVIQMANISVVTKIEHVKETQGGQSNCVEKEVVENITTATTVAPNDGVNNEKRQIKASSECQSHTSPALQEAPVQSPALHQPQSHNQQQHQSQNLNPKHQQHIVHYQQNTHNHHHHYTSSQQQQQTTQQGQYQRHNPNPHHSHHPPQNPHQQSSQQTKPAQQLPQQQNECCQSFTPTQTSPPLRQVSRPPLLHKPPPQSSQLQQSPQPPPNSHHQSSYPQLNPQSNPQSQQSLLPQQNSHLGDPHLQETVNSQLNPQLNLHTQSRHEKITSSQQILPQPKQHSQLNSQTSQKPQPQENSQSQPKPHSESSLKPEQNVLPEQPSVALVRKTNGLPVGDENENKPSQGNRCPSKQAKNGLAVPSVQSGDTSRVKKWEPAVVFTDNAKFNHTVSGIEFGFGFDEPIVTTSDILCASENCVLDNEDSNCNNNHLNNNIAVTKDFSKLFKAPKNDKISYNYEELLRHLSKAWEVTLRLMEEDPKNIQYWRATGSTEEA